MSDTDTLLLLGAAALLGPALGLGRAVSDPDSPVALGAAAGLAAVGVGAGAGIFARIRPTAGGVHGIFIPPPEAAQDPWGALWSIPSPLAVFNPASWEQAWTEAQSFWGRLWG